MVINHQHFSSFWELFQSKSIQCLNVQEIKDIFCAQFNTDILLIFNADILLIFIHSFLCNLMALIYNQTKRFSCLRPHESRRPCTCTLALRLMLFKFKQTLCVYSRKVPKEQFLSGSNRCDSSQHVDF